MRTTNWIRTLLDDQGFCLHRDVPGAATTLSRMVADGVLVAPLRGLYLPADAHSLITVIRGVCALFPDAVVGGRAAAAVDYWPELDVGDITVLRPKNSVDRPGWSFSRRLVPPELVQQRCGMRLTDPSLTTLDLCSGALGADAIDEALRRRATTVTRLHTALRLTPSRRGNLARAAHLIDSRGRPWSAAERLAHRQLRDARIEGWVGNLRIVTAHGRRRYIDIAFPECRLAVEIDGDRFHRTPAQRHDDRMRHNELVRAGWTVVRVDWTMLHEPGYLVRLVQELLAALS